MPVAEFYEALDEACVTELSEGKRRTHLGPSTAGNPCPAAVWYSYRWVKEEQHDGRKKRLFKRGHEEEFRVVRWLRAMSGVEVRDYTERLMFHDGSDSYVTIPWDDDGSDRAWLECDDVSDSQMHIQRATDRGQGPKQWGFSTEGGHYKGSSDGKISGLEPWFPEAVGWGLFENKTHNEKSFKDLQKKGLVKSKLQHFNQMQQYMKFLGLRWGLYVAVCKDDDDIYVEIVPYVPEVAERLVENTYAVMGSQQRPKQISQDPSWFKCMLCTKYRDICHHNAPTEKNCRSCVYAVPEAEGRWRCNKFKQLIPEDFIPEGCDEWFPIA